MPEEVRHIRTPAETSGSTARSAMSIALALLLTLEAFRVLFPDLYGFKERTGLAPTLVAVALVALSPLASPILATSVGRRRALAGTMVALAVWRLAVQLVTPIPVSVAGAGAVTALVALTLALTAPVDDDVAARGTGIVMGFALDVALVTSMHTWEPVFQRATTALFVAAALAAALIAAAVLVARARDTDGSIDRRSPAWSAGIAVGAVVALEVLFLANPAYIAAASGSGPGASSLATTVGLLGALVGVRLARRIDAGPFTAAIAVLTIAGFMLPEMSGSIVTAVVWAAQVAAGVVIGTALGTDADDTVRATSGLALGWALALVAILLFQLHYDQPLPIDNRFVTAMMGSATMLAGPPSRRRGDRASGAWMPAMVVVCACGLSGFAIAVPTAPSPTSPTASVESLAVVQWNVRQAVNDRGQLDPAAIATGIRSQGVADIVVLNEVGRGWPLSGQLDLATWLARDLDMHMAWGGAASQQFGTLVLSRLPIVSTAVVTLPVAGDSQGRSLLRVGIDVGEGRAIEVLATHLQHRNDPVSMAARLDEIGVIIDEWNGEPMTILAGDLNPRQGDPPRYPLRRPGEFDEIAALLEAGLTTMSDLDECSAPTSGPNCSDYVFVSPDLEQTSYAVGDEFGDHRLVRTTIVAPSLP